MENTEYTQAEVSNFSILKDAFEQQNELYYNRERLYEIVSQTPRVLLMKYKEDDKSTYCLKCWSWRFTK